MNRFKWMVLIGTLALMAVTAGSLAWLKQHHRLGPPGLIHQPTTNGVVVAMDLPAQVGEFDSTNLPQADVVTKILPKDTSFAQRRYIAPDGFWANGNVILMGVDRTSIHKPDYCLAGQGFNALRRTVESIPVSDGTNDYVLQVSRWNCGKTVQHEGKPVEVGAVYVFWFVTKDDQTPLHLQFMRKLGWHLLTTGELQRWAYVSYLAICMPGQEEETFERMKKLIAASVPRFQLPPKAASAGP